MALAVACCHAGNDRPFHREVTLAPAGEEAEDGGGGGAEEQTHDAAELAKVAQNPVSDLVSLPLQNNFNFGVGPDNDVNYNLPKDWCLNSVPFITAD